MKKKELKELIDTEVSKVFSDMTSKEPEAEKEMKETPKVKNCTQNNKLNRGRVGLHMVWRTKEKRKLK